MDVDCDDVHKMMLLAVDDGFTGDAEDGDDADGGGIAESAADGSNHDDAPAAGCFQTLSPQQGNRARFRREVVFAKR